MSSQRIPRSVTLNLCWSPVTAAEHLSAEGTQRCWQRRGVVVERHWSSFATFLITGTCVYVRIETTESPSTPEDRSLGSNRINSEFKVKINAVGQQSRFKIVGRVPRAQSPVLSQGESSNTDPLLGKSLPRSRSYCGIRQLKRASEMSR